MWEFPLMVHWKTGCMLEGLKPRRLHMVFVLYLSHLLNFRRWVTGWMLTGYCVYFVSFSRICSWGRKGLSSSSATGYFMPMESSPFLNWISLSRTCLCLPWYLPLPFSTWWQQSTQSPHASSPKVGMDIERSLCQQLCPTDLDEAILVLVMLWKLLFSKRSCLCASLLVKHLWVRLYNIKKLHFVFFLSIWYGSKAMSFYLCITVNLYKKLVTHPSTMVCLCTVRFLTQSLNKTIEPGFE